MRLSHGAVVCGVIICSPRPCTAQSFVTVLIPPAAASHDTAPRIALARRALLLDRAPPPFVRAMLGAVAISSVVSLEDGAIMRQVARMRETASRLDGVSTLCSSIGGAGPLALGVALWSGGAVAGNGFIKRLGVETTQSVMLSGALTIGIKGLVGRVRPAGASGDPDRYYPGRGFFDSQRASFPSGHTSSAFAVATVLSRELSARHPSQRHWIRGILYGSATAIGLSRVYQKAHWPSDVVTGAALGTLSGMSVLSWRRGTS